MRKSNVVEILARRLGATPSRVDAIAQRLADAGKLSRAEGSRRYPPDLAEPEIVSLIIGTIADNGLGNVRETVELFSGLTNHLGQRFDRFLSDILFGPTSVLSHVIVRHAPAGVSLTINGAHMVFGEERSSATATKAAIIPGESIIAIAAELQDATPEQADAMVAITRFQNGY